MINVYSSMSEADLSYMFNSDTMYFPSLFRDVFKDGYGLSGWTLPGAPGFFPDMFLYFIVAFFFENPVYTAFFYGIIQYIVLLLLSNLLISEISQKNKFLLYSAVNLSISAFLLLHLLANDFIFTFHIISFSYHLGPFLLALTAFIFLLKYFKTFKKKYLIVISIISFIAIFNDKLYIVIFSIPAVFSLFFISKNNAKNVLLFNLYNILSVIFAIFIFKQFMNLKIADIANNFKMFSFTGISDSFSVFKEMIFSYFLRYNFFTVFLIIVSVSLLFSIIFLAFNTRKFFDKTDDKPASKIVFLYFLITTVSASGILIAPLITGNFVDVSCLRYNFSGFVLLFINFFPILFIWFETGKYYKLFRIILFICLLFVFGFTTKTFFEKNDSAKLKQYFEHKPAYVPCFDKNISEKKYKYGVGTYWISKTSALFTASGARIYTVYDESMYPYPHCSNSNWYSENTGDFSMPIYNFILINSSQNITCILKNIGEPDSLSFCDKYIFLFYDKGFRYIKNDRNFIISSQYPKLLKDKNRFSTDFESKLFMLNNEHNISDKYAFSGKYSQKIGKEKNESFCFKLNYDELEQTTSYNLETVFNLFYLPESNPKTELVLTIENEGNLIFEKKIEIKYELLNKEKWNNMKFEIKLPENIKANSVIKTYIQSDSGSEIYIDDFEIFFKQ